MTYWLFKTEPGCFSFDDLKKRPDMTEPWDGVRNFQARNFLRDSIKVGDRVLFYHSNIPEPAWSAWRRSCGPAIRIQPP